MDHTTGLKDLASLWRGGRPCSFYLLPPRDTACFHSWTPKLPPLSEAWGSWRPARLSKQCLSSLKVQSNHWDCGKMQILVQEVLGTAWASTLLASSKANLRLAPWRAANLYNTPPPTYTHTFPPGISWASVEEQRGNQAEWVETEAAHIKALGIWLISRQSHFHNSVLTQIIKRGPTLLGWDQRRIKYS